MWGVLQTPHMSEKKFEELFGPYGKRALLHKLTDTGEVNGGRAKSAPIIKVKSQPSDYVVTFDGTMFYAEIKSSESTTSFPFGNIRDCQMVASKRQLAAGGQYFFFILRTKVGTWFRVPANVIHNWPRQSMTWAELEHYRF
jgi:penicillin-binding protein-related factor A (putative recombinase)